MGSHACIMDGGYETGSTHAQFKVWGGLYIHMTALRGEVCTYRLSEPRHNWSCFTSHSRENNILLHSRLLE